MADPEYAARLERGRRLHARFHVIACALRRGIRAEPWPAYSNCPPFATARAAPGSEEAHVRVIGGDQAGVAATAELAAGFLGRFGFEVAESRTLGGVKNVDYTEWDDETEYRPDTVVVHDARFVRALDGRPPAWPALDALARIERTEFPEPGPRGEVRHGLLTAIVLLPVAIVLGACTAVFSIAIGWKYRPERAAIGAAIGVAGALAGLYGLWRLVPAFFSGWRRKRWEERIGGPLRMVAWAERYAGVIRE